MNAAAVSNRYDSRHPVTYSTGFAGAVVQSTLLHIFVIVVGMVSMPFIAKDPIIVPPPVTVEIVDIDEITQSKRNPSRRAKAPEQQKPQPPQSKPKPPKVVAKKAPNMLKPAPPDLKDKVASPREASEVAALKRKDIKKPDIPKPKKEEPKPAPSQSDDFQSLLKNLTPDASEEVDRSEADNPDLNQEHTPFLPRIGERITISEEDALRRQLGQCWNVLAGAKYAEDLAVEVRVVVNPDRTVQQAYIVDRGRYGRDPAFRAAADAALRALRNPRCTPLALPPEKYESWKTTIIRFDPKEML